MKDRNISHADDWATPPYFLDELTREFDFNFDPCPFRHDLSKWDGLKVEWKERNFINPPYSRSLKEAFIRKAVTESRKGKLCVMLLPVSTSTKIFHEVILPEKPEIRFVFKRVKFIGINTKGEYVNWDLWDSISPSGCLCVRNSGMHDSMVVVFDGRIS
jgi:hypothetical protein